MKEVTNLNKESIVIRCYKVERWLWNKKMYFLARVMWRFIYIVLVFSCSIPPTTVLEQGVNIGHGLGIVIHQNSIVGENTIIYQNVTIGGGNGPKIGKNCFIGAGAVINGDIVIGDDVKIGANAVVLDNIPDGETVVGIPGKIVKIYDKKI